MAKHGKTNGFKTVYVLVELCFDYFVIYAFFVVARTNLSSRFNQPFSRCRYLNCIIVRMNVLPLDSNTNTRTSIANVISS